MSPITLTLLLATSLFGLFLFLKTLTKLKFCALCAAVFVSWLVLLILLKAQIWNEPIIVALLLGQSITGLFYLSRKVEQLKIFGLPIILTLTFLAFGLISEKIDFTTAILLLAFWLLFTAIFLLRNRSSALKILAEKIIACCRDW